MPRQFYSLTLLPNNTANYPVVIADRTAPRFMAVTKLPADCVSLVGYVMSGRDRGSLTVLALIRING